MAKNEPERGQDCIAPSTAIMEFFSELLDHGTCDGIDLQITEKILDQLELLAILTLSFWSQVSELVRPAVSEDQVGN